MASIRRTNRRKRKISPTGIIVISIILFKIYFAWSDSYKTTPQQAELVKQETQHEVALPQDSSKKNHDDMVLQTPVPSQEDSSKKKNHDDTRVQQPLQCSHDDLLKIRHQLPPEMCISDYEGNTPWLQRCSLTIATKCPKATWLEEYYQELQQNYIQNLSQNDKKHFLGISIGCNKGFDAIHTLRMGTFNHNINKQDWKQAMESKGGKLHDAVCGQDSGDLFAISPALQNMTMDKPKGEMHCVEPMPKTFDSLEYSSKHLQYDEYGFHVTNAAISKESGTMYFPSNTNSSSGIENQGLATCTNHMTEEERLEQCRPVTVFSLQDFVRQNVKSQGPIHILSIDVEGFDCDVLSGAGKDVLQRVEYLEFEYNYMGSWAHVHLYDVIEMLNEIGFTCYWAGMDLLWRITNCWQSFYDLHAWSNVACVNRDAVPQLANKMEEKFQSSLNHTKKWNKFPVFARRAREQYKEHDLMSLDHEKLTQRYYLKEPEAISKSKNEQ